MREIKFRAYDEELEEWFYLDKKDDIHFFEFKDGRLRGFAIREPRPSSDPYEPPEPYCDDYDPYEFTGLLDKNGKEIYEGDIIKADGMFNDLIIYENGGFNLKGGDSGLNILYQLEQYGNYVVIGNVYENPDLLEKANVQP